MTAILSRSPESAALDSCARHHVDRVDRDHYEGRMPADLAREIYRTCVAAQAQRYLLDELAPINRELAWLSALSLEPLIVPPSVEELRFRIATKWQAAVIELLQ